VAGGHHERTIDRSGMIDPNQDLKQKGLVQEESKASLALNIDHLTFCRCLFTNRSPFLFLRVGLKQMLEIDCRLSHNQEDKIYDHCSSTTNSFFGDVFRQALLIQGWMEKMCGFNANVL
jgi:hypothetical protein